MNTQQIQIVNVANKHGFEAYPFNENTTVVEIPWTRDNGREKGVEIHIVDNVNDLYSKLGY